MKSRNDCPFLVCSQCWLVPSDLIISAALLTRLPSFSDITLETFLIQSMVAQRPFSKLLPARPSSSLPLIEFVSHRSPVYHNTSPPCPLASHPFGSSSFLLLVAFISVAAPVSSLYLHGGHMMQRKDSRLPGAEILKACLPLSRYTGDPQFPICKTALMVFL